VLIYGKDLEIFLAENIHVSVCGSDEDPAAEGGGQVSKVSS
jgi:hypothetical protein